PPLSPYPGYEGPPSNASTRADARRGNRAEGGGQLGGTIGISAAGRTVAVTRGAHGAEAGTSRRPRPLRQGPRLRVRALGSPVVVPPARCASPRGSDPARRRTRRTQRSRPRSVP